MLGGQSVVLDDAHHHDEPAPGERHFHEGAREPHTHRDRSR
jgi:hypothetical protein